MASRGLARRLAPLDVAFLWPFMTGLRYGSGGVGQEWPWDWLVNTV